MNRRVRRFLLVAATAIFVVVTPFIILYALGFRFTRARVGVLLLDSFPSRADVFVNSQRVGTTPQTISGVGDSSAAVSIRKEGYQAWEKRLSFTTGTTSAYSGIVLLPDSLQLQSLVAPVRQFSLAPNRSLIAAVIQPNKLAIYDEGGRVILPALQLPQTPASFQWSPDSTFLAVSYSAARHAVISLSDGLLHSPPALTLRDENSLAWDPRAPGRLLALSEDGQLMAFTVGEGVLEPLASNITAFAPAARDIIALTPESLVRVSLQGAVNKTVIVPLPKPARQIFLGGEKSIAIWFEDGSVSLQSGNSFTEIAASVLSLGFSPDGGLLYLQTAPSELMVYNVSNERLLHTPLRRPYLVTRVSAPITHPQWFAGGQHLIYQLGDQIMLTEIDTRDHAITRMIDSTNMSDAQITVGENGESLFYLKRSPEGVVSLVRADLVIP